MNQILESNLDLNYSPKYNTNIIAKKFKIILFSAISLILFFLILYFLLKYNSYKKEKISKNLASNFNIQNNYLGKIYMHILISVVLKSINKIIRNIEEKENSEKGRIYLWEQKKN